MDCLVLVPIADGYIHLDECAIQYSGGNQRARIRTLPNGEIVGWAWNSSWVPITPVISPNEWGLPVEDGMIVVAAQRSDQQVLGDRVGMTVYFVDRTRAGGSQ